jgi:hypothetical protein
MQRFQNANGIAQQTTAARRGCWDFMDANLSGKDFPSSQFDLFYFLFHFNLLNGADRASLRVWRGGRSF